jgi:tetratricopeptide (TPR) repeat protein
MTNGNDCVACHMPKMQAVDGLHTAFTDHSIPKSVGVKPDATAAGHGGILMPFWDGPAQSRDLGLAYAVLAARSQRAEDYSRAMSALKSAVKQAPADTEVLAQLGYMLQLSGDHNQALPFYREAVQADSANFVALVNLANLIAMQGEVSEAIRLWRSALSYNPGLEAAAVNLAQVYLQNGNRLAARESLLKVLEFNPDSPRVRNLLSAIASKADR